MSIGNLVLVGGTTVILLAIVVVTVFALKRRKHDSTGKRPPHDIYPLW